MPERPPKIPVTFSLPCCHRPVERNIRGPAYHENKRGSYWTRSVKLKCIPCGTTWEVTLKPAPKGKLPPPNARKYIPTNDAAREIMPPADS